MHIHQPVFVILPLNNADHVHHVFDEGIKPALAQFGFEARRIDDQAVRGSIIGAIQKEINLAYFVIADLSSERPNCYYEMGYAQAIGKPVLLIKDHETVVHFDVANQMVHSFGPNMAVRDLITSLVPKFLETTLRHPRDNRNGEFGRCCIRDRFRLTAKIEKCTKRDCELTFEVCELDKKTPLTGVVKFYMHRSYKRSVQPIRAKGGIARYQKVTASGPWTLGALVQKTGTKLELDLATIPGGRAWWYQEAYKENIPSPFR